MLHFDTSGLPAAECLRQITRHLTGAFGECRVTHLGDEAAVWGRWRSAKLSSTTGVCRYDGSAVRVTRRALDVVADPSGWLNFAVSAYGGSTFWQRGWLRQLQPGELVMVDVGSPYDFRSVGGSCSVVQTDPFSLGVTTAQARAAALHLRDSPLHDLTRDHVRALADVSCPATPDPDAVSAVAMATTRLLGALVISCGPGG